MERAETTPALAPARPAGPIGNATVVSMAAIVGVGFLFAAIVVFYPPALSLWRVAAAIAALAAGLPFLVLGVKKADVLIEQLELEAWIHHRMTLDLNGDGLIGPHGRGPILLNTNSHATTLPDENHTTVLTSALVQFVTRSTTLGLTWEAAQRAGLNRAEWSAVIESLAAAGAATSKAQGVDSELLVESDEALAVLIR